MSSGGNDAADLAWLSWITRSPDSFTVQQMLLPNFENFATSRPQTTQVFPRMAGLVWRHAPMYRTCLSLALVCFLLAVVGNRTAEASPLDADTMKAALHTATPEEDGFIEYVLTRVDKGTLPLDLVQGTFLWAKKKPRRKFQYFKQGLIVRAQQQGISL